MHLNLCFKYMQIRVLLSHNMAALCAGACPGFLKGGGVQYLLYNMMEKIQQPPD